MGGGRGQTLVAYDSGSTFRDDDDPTMPHLITHEPKRKLRGALDAYVAYSSEEDTEMATGERELREALGAARLKDTANAGNAGSSGSTAHERELREALDAVTGPDDIIDVAPCAYIWSTLVMIGARISDVFRVKWG